ncbi:MAG TPA: alpha/beta hydrolase [Acidimicrobiales bacterium]
MPRSTASPAGRSPARRVDDRAGITEVAELFGPDGARLLGVRSAPSGPARGAVLCCSSIGNDLVKHYRREVLLARALAGAGVAVQRFQYRGTGNSDGDQADVSRGSMVEDATAAAALLEAAAPGVPAAVVGARFGALVAAEAAAADTRPLVLVEPVLDGSRYFTEAFRAKLMQSLAGSRGARPTTADFVAAIDRGEAVDVLGNPVHPALYRSWQGRSVAGALTGPRRSVLLVQFGDDVPVRPDLEKAAAGLSELGHDVEVVQVRGRETWWFLDERELVRVGGGRGQAAAGDAEPGDRPGATDGLLGAVVPWLVERLGAAA